jgi:hypothetical protein
MYRKLIFAWLLVVLLTTISANAQQAEWFGFPAYPGARELCTQSVLGQQGEEILWHSYATKDKPSQVIAFYVKDNGRNKDTQGQAEQNGDMLTLRHEDTVLSVHVAGGDYPQCGHKPHTAERTVIVVSRKTDRGRR